MEEGIWRGAQRTGNVRRTEPKISDLGDGKRPQQRNVGGLLKLEKTNNNNRISWEPSGGIQPCQHFAFRSVTPILSFWSSELWWWWCSVTRSYPILWDSMYCSVPGFPVLHYFPEIVQIHVHWANDAIQPSQPLSHHFPAFNLSKHQDLFQWVSSSHQVAKVLEFQLQH